MISAAFIRRPRLAVVIAIVITIAGAIAMLRIPVAQFPDIVPPRVQVTATYPGASAAVVEAAIAQPLEAQIVGVDKMIYMKSTSGNDGSYNLTVSFAVGTNPDTATVNVNNRVQTAIPQLPQAVQLQGLSVIKRSAAVLQFMNLYSETGQLSPVQITSYATINVLDELSRVTGVGQALLFGKLNYSMRIWFDTQRLTSLNLSPSDVVQAIQAQNVQAPVGRIGARPVSDDQQFQLNVQTQGTLTTPEQFRKIVLRANPDGSVLRIGDVARVEMGAQNSDTETRINGRPAVGIALYLAPDANAVATAAAVEKALERLRARFPPDLKAYVVYDSTVFVNDTIHEVLTTVSEAFVLVVIVVFLFLGSVRATIIPAVAVPVSLIGTFAFLLLAGYSANTVSLLALVLAIGIVVDDAIVVVENVERVMQEHPEMEPHEATAEAMRQITGPIIAISLVLLSVFVPVAFIPGISGQLFRQFAVTISIAMLISALNALTLSPALCAIFLRHEIPTRGPIFQVLRAINVVRDGYARVVQRLIRVSFISLLLVALIGAGIFGLARITPTSFLPEEDQGAFFLNVQLPDGASVSRTSETMRVVEATLKKMPQVQDVFAVIGFSLLDGANEANTAFAVAKLKPFEDRRGAADSAQALIRRTFAEGAQIRTANIVAFNLPPIIGLSTSGGFEFQLEALEGQDPVRLGAVMGGVVAAANQDRRLSRVFSTFTASNPSIYLDIDRDKAQALGLAMNDVFTALQSTLGGFFVNNFNLYGRTWQVNIQGEANDRRRIEDIFQIQIRNRQGEMVPLRSIADLRFVLGPQVITRYNN
ncbi:MAG: efflux RND transporter permease subunit, partial [Rhodospirillaceae bacterium]